MDDVKIETPPENPHANPQASILRRLEAEYTETRALVGAVVEFLGFAFPHVPPPPLEKLKAAALDLFCSEIAHRIAIVRSATPYPIETPEEHIADLETEKDALLQQLATAEEGLAKAKAANVPGYADMMEASILMPLRARLEGIERHIAEHRSGNGNGGNA